MTLLCASRAQSALILRVAAQMREFVASALLEFFNTIRRKRQFGANRGHPSIGWRTGQSATQKRPSVGAKRVANPHSSISTPNHAADAPPGACGRKPHRIDFSTPPRQRSRSLRRSARPGDARRQREPCSPAGPLPPPLRRKRPRSRPLIGRRPRRGRHSDENRFAARPLFR